MSQRYNNWQFPFLHHKEIVHLFLPFVYIPLFVDAKFELLNSVAEQHLHFQHGKILANAVIWTMRERHKSCRVMDELALIGLGLRQRREGLEPFGNKPPFRPKGVG